MFTKFITLFLDDFDDEEKGFFNAARYLSENGILEENRKRQLNENLNWLSQNLPKRPDYDSQGDEDSISLPMSWLKNSAKEHIRRMNEIKEILEENDILVEVLEVNKPGEIVYEDEFQVVAIPFQESIMR